MSSPVIPQEVCRGMATTHKNPSASVNPPQWVSQVSTISHGIANSTARAYRKTKSSVNKTKVVVHKIKNNINVRRHAMDYEAEKAHNPLSALDHGSWHSNDSYMFFHPDDVRPVIEAEEYMMFGANGSGIDGQQCCDEAVKNPSHTCLQARLKRGGDYEPDGDGIQRYPQVVSPMSPMSQANVVYSDQVVDKTSKMVDGEVEPKSFMDLTDSDDGQKKTWVRRTIKALHKRTSSAPSSGMPTYAGDFRRIKYADGMIAFPCPGEPRLVSPCVGRTGPKGIPVAGPPVVPRQPSHSANSYNRHSHQPFSNVSIEGGNHGVTRSATRGKELPLKRYSHQPFLDVPVDRIRQSEKDAVKKSSEESSMECSAGSYTPRSSNISTQATEFSPSDRNSLYHGDIQAFMNSLLENVSPATKKEIREYLARTMIPPFASAEVERHVEAVQDDDASLWPAPLRINKVKSPAPAPNIRPASECFLTMANGSPVQRSSTTSHRNSTLRTRAYPIASVEAFMPKERDSYHACEMKEDVEESKEVLEEFPSFM